MKFNEKQSEVTEKVDKIYYAVMKTIDKICEEENFEVSYCELNSALIKILSNFNYQELKELWESPEEVNK